MTMDILHDTYTWVFVSFAVFVAVLWAFGRPALLRALDQKIATIRSEVENAATLHAQAQALLAEYEQRQRDAARETDAILADGRAQAEKHREIEEARLHDMMARKEQQLVERLGMLRDQAVAELRDVAAQLSYQATEKIVTQGLDDATRTALINRSLAQVQDRLQA
jgi:F-type H+-transporting ATPase subunit b